MACDYPGDGNDPRHREVYIVTVLTLSFAIHSVHDVNKTEAATFLSTFYISKLFTMNVSCDKIIIPFYFKM